MKVYSWKSLLTTVLFGGSLSVYTLVTALRGDTKNWLWFFACLYVTSSGLYSALTREGYERERKQTARYKRVTRRLFGPLAPIVPWSHLILLVLVCCTVPLWPSAGVLLLLLLGVVVYAIWLSWYIQRAVNREKAEEEGKNLLNETDKE